MTPTATAIALVALTALTLAIVGALRLEKPWLQPWSIIRAILQLGLLSLVLTTVIEDARWVVAFLLVMVVAATVTVVRRLGMRILSADAPRIAAVVVVAAAIPVGILFLTGAVEQSPRYLLATGGIVVGAAMTATTLLGRSLGSLIAREREQIEGWLALGATPRQAARDVLREAASGALIPATDQARTTGLVTLPGAFVGAIFAGAPPLEAAQFQLVVLASALAAGSLVAVGMAAFYGAPRLLPREGAILH